MKTLSKSTDITATGLDGKVRHISYRDGGLEITRLFEVTDWPFIQTMLSSASWVPWIPYGAAYGLA